ncbi:MAG: Gfo/Idh/MocA family oxidoreductase [Chromatiaceae bacterium]|nr:Gfo/Idh/MocA family oxidoreductase [Chromatiaceae bacterium]
MNKPLRLGFIGGGVNSAVGTTHFIAAQMDGLFRVDAGCFSRHADVNEQTAAQWGIAGDRCYARWEEMLEREQDRLDGIVVLTPTPMHRDPVIGALQAGYPVICEKALATTASEAEEIEQTVNETKGFLTVTYNYTGYPMVRELREMIQSGRLGRVEQVHLEMPQEGFARLNRDGQPVIPQQWRLQDGVVPTISLDLGVHLHHLVDFLTGEKPRELVATQSSLGRFRQVVDNTMALVRYTNDLESSFWFSKAALGYRNGLRVRVFGEEASAEWVQMDPEVLQFSDNRGHQMRIDRASSDVQLAQLDRYNRFKSGHPAGFLEAFANLYGDIAKTLGGGKSDGCQFSDYVFSARHAREGLILLEAIGRSARERQWIAPDLGDSL